MLEAQKRFRGRRNSGGTRAGFPCDPSREALRAAFFFGMAEAMACPGEGRASRPIHSGAARRDSALGAREAEACQAERIRALKSLGWPGGRPRSRIGRVPGIIAERAGGAVFAAAAGDFFFLLILLIVAVIFGRAYYFRRNLLKDLERVAQEMGFRFQAEEHKVPLPVRGFDALPLFKRNSRRSSFLYGRRATGEVFLADVRVGSGESAYMQTVACFYLSDRRLPAFELSAKWWAHKIAEVFGYKDIDFESSPEFSKSYLLRGPDEAAVRELFRAELLHFFTGEKGWTVEGKDELLCVYRGDSLGVSPKELGSFLAKAERVARLFGARG